MDYKNLFLRIPVTLLFILTFILIVIKHDDYIKLLVYPIYIIIFIEIIFFFRKDLFIFFTSIIYIFLSLICLEFYFNFFYIKNEFIFSILLIVIFDIFSYLFGSIFGKLKILPSISPNKTYFGLLSGFFMAFFIGYICNYYFQIYDSYLIFIIIIFTILAGFLGDIIESFFKRRLNIKNSSNILLGHGGFFDRFDSLIMVVIWLFIFNLI